MEWQTVYTLIGAIWSGPALFAYAILKEKLAYEISAQLPYCKIYSEHYWNGSNIKVKGVVLRYIFKSITIDVNGNSNALAYVTRRLIG